MLPHRGPEFAVGGGTEGEGRRRGGGREKEIKKKKENGEGEGEKKKKEGTSFDFVRTKPDSLIERFLLTRL